MLNSPHLAQLHLHTSTAGLVHTPVESICILEQCQPQAVIAIPSGVFMHLRLQQLICGAYKSGRGWKTELSQDLSASYSHAGCKFSMNLNKMEVFPVLPTGHVRIMQLEAIPCWKRMKRWSNNHHHSSMVQLRCLEGWQALALASSSPCSAPQIGRPHPAWMSSFIERRQPAVAMLSLNMISEVMQCPLESSGAG